MNITKVIETLADIKNTMGECEVLLIALDTEDEIFDIKYDDDLEAVVIIGQSSKDDDE